MIKNALSVDLESFIHRQLDVKKRTVSDNEFTVQATRYLLDLFDKYNSKVTFFVLGEIYDWYPQLIEEIKRKGHEIGYHGHRHIIIRSKKVLEEELRRSKEFINKYMPIGFRAPRMYLREDCLETLLNAGFRYDSSVYGSYIRKVKNYSIKEIPVSSYSYFLTKDSLNYPQSIGIELLLKAMPFGSGLFMSVLQKKTQYFINATNRKGLSAVLFVHPWQFLDYQKDFSKSIPILQKLAYKKNLNNTLEYLLSKNRFFPLKDLI